MLLRYMLGGHGPVIGWAGSCSYHSWAIFPFQPSTCSSRPTPPDWASLRTASIWLLILCQSWSLTLHLIASWHNCWSQHSEVVVLCLQLLYLILHFPSCVFNAHSFGFGYRHRQSNISSSLCYWFPVKESCSVISSRGLNCCCFLHIPDWGALHYF